MKKARIILTFIILSALAGGGLAFKFNGQPVWRITAYLITIISGRTYATYGVFYTSSGVTLFISTAGFISTVYKTTAILPPTTVVATATDGSGLTTQITTYTVISTVTRVTVLN
ncbi:hypothetical protein [Chitinophaga pinensis]|uniref:Uncharacterized protein n=1 Tax=Chitinophaga pinensis (strain ATCC 43595 / DSM 2588 / LMG 13176 / NBRC 15968 / NCIMB 11800 / UQM 2034) TaxID=485918 RepID=A0A979GUX4_CHIPD|nr:hypothetical protein [Chitinophaga pinensis]ACU60666.1 hypothetical protein Cpin_3199 [Chitinophaga pinensis DSM 2588]